MFKTQNLWELAVLFMSEKLENHTFHEILSDRMNRKRKDNSFVHPLASKDTGYHAVYSSTDVSSYETNEIAQMLLDINHNSTDAFIQMIRRRLFT
jgi:hypothetical protein